MVIEKHIGTCDKMTYETRDLRHERWTIHLSYKGLRRIPKLKDDIRYLFMTTDSDEVWSNSQRLSADCALNDNEYGDRSSPVQGTGEGNDDENTAVNENPLSSNQDGGIPLKVSTSNADGRQSRGENVGRKKSRKAFHEEKMKEIA